MATVAPFGSWASPITASVVARAGLGLTELRPSGRDVCWLERRAVEGGRQALVRAGQDGAIADLTPAATSVRTTVHEYGGGDYVAWGSAVVYADFADQRLYRIDLDQGASAPAPVTPEPPAPRSHRYADMRLTPDGRRIVCVRERHEAGEVLNELVTLPSDGSAEPRLVVGGNDFYSFPRVSPDGRRLAWTTWNHPDMPWDATELWVGELTHEGEVREPRRVAGGPSESIYQPEWSPGGVLHFVSDRTGWWNLYRLGPEGPEPLASIDAEFGVPQWLFGTCTYAFLDEDRIVCIYGTQGVQHLALLSGGELREIETPYTSFPGPHLAVADGAVWFIGASARKAPAIARLDPATGATDERKQSLSLEVAAAYLSEPEPVAFQTTGGLTAHALFYPPANPDHQGPAGERAPLIVMSHGGPTSQTTTALRLEIQFWTSRGFAVADVNYRGSTGYGRSYRDQLRGQWGIADVEDCLNVAGHLARLGRVDGNRLAIRGGSAGGYTTLCALTFRDGFDAGASYYGVGDAEALAKHTHKFESRYLDRLLGPYPEAADVYRERSPVFHVDRLSTPVILFQGLEDAVVPPSQAELMVEALRRKGVPFAYLAFEGEQHGFRRAETIERSLEAELYFYSRVFGFEPADRLEPVSIENEASLNRGRR